MSNRHYFLHLKSSLLLSFETKLNIYSVSVNVSIPFLRYCTAIQSTLDITHPSPLLSNPSATADICHHYSMHYIAQPVLQSTATGINQLKLADPLETAVGVCTFAPLSLPAGYDICEFHSVILPQKYDPNKTVLYNKVLFPCFMVSILISTIAISWCMCHSSKMPS